MRALSPEVLQVLLAANVEADKIDRKSSAYLSRKAEPGETILTLPRRAASIASSRKPMR